MRRLSPVEQACHTHERVSHTNECGMSHTRIRHVTHVNAACNVYACITSQIRSVHGIQLNMFTREIHMG